MKNQIENINKSFESRVRLGILSVLMGNEKAEFKTLKDLLRLTDGNLASHIKGLEELDYIQVQKQFVGKKPNTSYTITQKGRSAFLAHLDALEKFINSIA